MFDTAALERPATGSSLAHASAAIDDVVAIQRQIDELEGRKLVAVEQARRAAARAESALLSDDDVTLSRAGAERRHDLARRAFTADLATALRLTEQAASHLLDTARTLAGDGDLAVTHDENGRATLDALCRGRVSLAHATAVADTLAELPTPEARDQVEAAVLPRAATCTVPQLRRHLRRARDLVHPEPFVERHRRATESRAVYLDPGTDGMAWLTAHLPAPLAHAAYDRLSRTGAHAKEAGDGRTLAQLRADSLADLLLADDVPTAARSAPVLAQIARRITPTVRVTVPVLSLLGSSDLAAELDGHVPVDAATASSLAAAAPSLRRLLVDPADGRVLTTDPGTYTVPAALRGFLQERDSVCRFPGCTRSAARCDVDHVVAWADGGRTVADNLAHLCRHHHVLKHQTSWRSAPGPDGTLTWTSPTGRTHHDPPGPPLPDHPVRHLEPPDDAPDDG
ncbi:DUF222 domain-containing protein [Promicromonospora sp. Marseille-Q5078]